jgi:PTH1 family peptidyl-tRNA hydrolase
MSAVWGAVGLGNPGERYVATRHNVGFRVVEELASRRSLRWFRLGSLMLAGRLGGGLVLARPLTFMNRSGAAVDELVNGLGLSPSSLLVVYDDVDLALGRLRVRLRGGAGTHNGMRDIVERVGSEIPRLRIGVRGDDAGVADLADYVLSPFSEAENELAETAVRAAADAVEIAESEGLTAAMNSVNGLILTGSDAAEER